MYSLLLFAALNLHIGSIDNVEDQPIWAWRPVFVAVNENSGSLLIDIDREVIIFNNERFNIENCSENQIYCINSNLITFSFSCQNMESSNETKVRNIGGEVGFLAARHHPTPPNFNYYFISNKKSPHYGIVYSPERGISAVLVDKNTNISDLNLEGGILDYLDQSDTIRYMPLTLDSFAACR